MPRYEFKDATSSKFWTIDQNETAYTVSYGKIGTEGVEQTKEFDSDEACKKAYDKFVAAKVKKGYALVDGVNEDVEASEEPQEAAMGVPNQSPLEPSRPGMNGSSQRKMPRAKTMALSLGGALMEPAVAEPNM